MSKTTTYENKHTKQKIMMHKSFKIQQVNPKCGGNKTIKPKDTIK